ncbi:MAG: S8 family peptidase [Velocimicrobium sp.]
MENAKLDTSLNLALDTPETVRLDTSDLGVGYNPITKKWELIVRFHGNLLNVMEELGANAVLLSGGYAIITIAQDKIGQLSRFEEIEFIEKPKKLEFAVLNAIPASCIQGIQKTPEGLYGEGVICAIIDSGIDYTHPDFRNQDGKTRILAFWDQTVPGTPPDGFIRGTLFTEEDINKILFDTEGEDLEDKILPSLDQSGHGTHVAGICAGNGRASRGIYRGVATKSELLIVKLGDSIGESFPRTTNLMEALQFIINFTMNLGKPVAINISFGNSYGSHSGRSLLETYIDDMAAMWKNVICVGTGNEGAAGRHQTGALENKKETIVELVIGEYETTMNLQIWKNYFDLFNIEIISPGGRSVGVLTAELGSNNFVLEDTQILFYYGAPRPYNALQELYIEFIPKKKYINSGIWKLRFIPRNIIDGNYAMWIPSGGVLNVNTKFLRPTEKTTLTIPSTAARVVTVGAYDSLLESYAYFSGRGYTWENQWVKPDIVAPGVGITSTAPGGGYTTKTGTSMATPFVTGGVALMMEWGIVKGNDPYLYGQKVKAYLIKGARKLPGFDVWPNPQLGYGALCVEDSLPL